MEMTCIHPSLLAMGKFAPASRERGQGGNEVSPYIVGARNLPPFASVETFGTPGTTTGGLI
jgi:hypothetical protein